MTYNTFECNLSGSFRTAPFFFVLRKILKIDLHDESLDATDGLAAALCHYYQSQQPKGEKSYSSWEEFAKKNPGRVK